MKYALITDKGKVYTFYILETARIYRAAYGGVLFSITEELTTPINDIEPAMVL